MEAPLGRPQLILCLPLHDCRRAGARAHKNLLYYPNFIICSTMKNPKISCRPTGGMIHHNHFLPPLLHRAKPVVSKLAFPIEVLVASRISSLILLTFCSVGLLNFQLFLFQAPRTSSSRRQRHLPNAGSAESGYCQGFEIGFDISSGESQRSERCELQKVLRDCTRTELEVNRRSRFTQSLDLRNLIRVAY